MPQLQMCCCQPRRGPGGSSRQSISRIGCLFHPHRGVSRTSLLPSSPTFLPEEKDGCPVTGVMTLTDISSSALTHRRLPMPLPRLTPSSPSRGLGGAFSPKQSPFLPLGFAPISTPILWNLATCPFLLTLVLSMLLSKWHLVYMNEAGFKPQSDLKRINTSSPGLVPPCPIFSARCLERRACSCSLPSLSSSLNQLPQLPVTLSGKDHSCCLDGQTC